MIKIIWKPVLFILLAFVLIAGIAFPIVPQPQKWYEFPLIPGLEEKARIIFFHVPVAWLSVVAFFMTMIFGIKYLRKQNPDDDLKSFSALQLGFVFCILATITGSIWAKFTWGAFWHWDPRETSIFVLLMIYGALFALRSAIQDEEKRAKLSAVYSVIAFLTVPFFVFIMPRIMTGLHPGSVNDDTSGPVIDFTMNGNMMLIFYLSLFSFSVLFFWLWNINYRLLIIKDKLFKQ